MTPQVPDLGEQMDSGIISQIRAQEEEQVSQERQKQCDYVECELYVQHPEEAILKEAVGTQGESLGWRSVIGEFRVQVEGGTMDMEEITRRE